MSLGFDTTQTPHLLLLFQKIRTCFEHMLHTYLSLIITSGARKWYVVLQLYTYSIMILCSWTVWTLVRTSSAVCYKQCMKTITCQVHWWQGMWWLFICVLILQVWVSDFSALYMCILPCSLHYLQKKCNASVIPSLDKISKHTEATEDT